MDHQRSSDGPGSESRSRGDTGQTAEAARCLSSETQDRETQAAGATRVDVARRRVEPILAERIAGDPTATPRQELARQISEIVAEVLANDGLVLSLPEQRDLIVALLKGLQSGQQARPERPAAVKPVPPRAMGRIETAKGRVRPVLLERIDPSVAARLPTDELAVQIGDIVGEIVVEQDLPLNQNEQRELVKLLLDDMLGLGPLEPLLADETITDILVNGPDQVYIERDGKLEPVDVCFRDDAHLMNVATRIVTRVGRRLDESSPLVDARLEDGSRVNIVAPPLALDGTTVSIRKFNKKSISLDLMAKQGNLSESLATLLKVAARCRLNILVSGGTGSGKTTVLNSLSQMVDGGERIVTIEDTAELRLQQPHVVRLETRVPNLEGQGEVTMRDLLRNSLRMRPDRIILGEVRGAEVLEMLQAMNTGHDGSMCTVHANSPRDALIRLENMVAMANVNLFEMSVRSQIAKAVQLIVQVSRMRDGMRRVVHVLEVVGMESGIVTTQDLFRFEYEGEASDGKLKGKFVCSGIRPRFLDRAEYYGLEKMLLEAVRC